MHKQLTEVVSVKLLKENIKNYFFEKGNMVIKGNNISEIVFLKKND